MFLTIKYWTRFLCVLSFTILIIEQSVARCRVAPQKCTFRRDKATFVKTWHFVSYWSPYGKFRRCDKLDFFLKLPTFWGFIPQVDSFMLKCFRNCDVVPSSFPHFITICSFQLDVLTFHSNNSFFLNIESNIRNSMDDNRWQYSIMLPCFHDDWARSCRCWDNSSDSDSSTISYSSYSRIYNYSSRHRKVSKTRQLNISVYKARHTYSRLKSTHAARTRWYMFSSRLTGFLVFSNQNHSLVASMFRWFRCSYILSSSALWAFHRHSAKQDRFSCRHQDQTWPIGNENVS